MSGLSFICEYSSDTETESDLEVKKRCRSTFVREFKSTDKKIAKQIIPPKLPAPDLSQVSVVSSETHVDDPLQHGGRSRSFPHVRGNWATYVYVKYPQEDYLLKLIEKLEKVFLLQNESWQRCSDVHISLSKTFTLSYHLITPFTSNLQKAVCDTESFELEFSGVKVYCNEDNTRTFIALAVDYFCQRYLLTLTQKVDDILRDYKLPKFYEDPSFHMSIFWMNGDKRSEVTNILNELNNIVISDTENHKTGLVDRVCCKTGNKSFQYHLL